MWLVKGGDEKCPNNQVALRRGRESVSATLFLGQELVECFPPPFFSYLTSPFSLHVNRKVSSVIGG
jgi:hypothetical protein